ncbi:MAG TPA: A24 family peptidase [Bryobacteraceae bacterium]|nr:A24 family peptidase [Bryobacteraceae bacterium]
MTIVGAISLVVGCAAAVEDLARRRISNWTSGAALVSGFLVHASRAGWRGAASAGTGALVGFVLFLIFYLLNGMGAGDLKLMAGFGSLLGPSVILYAAWIAAVAGGMMGLAYAAALAWRARSRVSRGRLAPAEMIPYAPAIVAGAWLAEFALG